MLYKYEGLDSFNNYVEGRLRCKDESELDGTMRKLGISAIEVKRVYFSSDLLILTVPLNDTTDLFKEVLSLLKTGLKPLEAVEYISTGASDNSRLSELGSKAYALMRNGSTLSAALREVGIATKYCDVISVGELTGNLMEAFEIEIEQIELQEKIKKGFNTIYIAPAVSAFFMLIATIATIIWLAPMQRKIIDALVTDPSQIPPFSTAAFWIADYGIQIIIGFFSTLFLLFIIKKILRKISEKLDVMFDLVSLSIPVFGLFYKYAEYSKIANILVLSMGAGGKQSSVLDVIRNQVTSPYFRKKINESYDLVLKEGYLISDAFSKVGLNSLLAVTLRRGEKMGKGEASLIVSRLAKEYEKKCLHNMEILKGASEMINMIMLSILSIPVLLISVAPAIDQVTLMMSRF